MGQATNCGESAVFLQAFLRSCAARETQVAKFAASARFLEVYFPRCSEIQLLKRECLLESMPIYEYVCDSCEHEFETIQKFNEDPLKACPECEQDALRKKISAAAFRLKGSGWYETDFKSGNKRNVVTDDKKSSEASSETKKPDKSTTTSSSSTKTTSSSEESKPSKSASSD